MIQEESNAPRQEEAADSEAVPHGCYEGLVFLGHMAEDPETGEEAEVVVAVPCRRCGRS